MNFHSIPMSQLISCPFCKHNTQSSNWHAFLGNRIILIQNVAFTIPSLGTLSPAAQGALLRAEQQWWPGQDTATLVLSSTLTAMVRSRHFISPYTLRNKNQNSPPMPRRLKSCFPTWLFPPTSWQLLLASKL